MMHQSVASWRRQQRATLIGARQAMSPHDRQIVADIIADKLNRVTTVLGTSIVGLYWPIKNEISMMPWGRALAQHKGVALCLPVVVTQKAPLEYWRWTPGEAMQPGCWNIPRPTHRDVLAPDLLLAPLVGFDQNNYRLGYGGGYFDRTLASLEPRPIVIGVGYDFSALETIFPQPHDIPMRAVLTERRDTLPVEWNEHAA
jgi:5-formyltetrahydrofolate cyclo-ligase